MINLFNMDCMEAMAKMPDKAFDLAIVDPPYGIGVGSVVGGRNLSAPKIYKGFDDSQLPGKEYFVELMRVSVNQIIFGGNYFIQHLRNTSCFIVWDKDNSGNFADCELAWASFDTAVRKYKYRWNGMIQEHMGKDKENRIHPTQKPVKLYEWLLKNYAKEGDKILDTHLGSGSIAIACYNMGFALNGYELDKDYYEAAVKRLNCCKKQRGLLSPKEIFNLVDGGVRRKIPKGKYKRAKELYEQGLSMQVIALRLGVSERSVCQWKQKWGWKVKNHGEGVCF